MSSKHGEEVATRSIAETSTVQDSACPTVQAQGRLSQVMKSEKNTRPASTHAQISVQARVRSRAASASIGVRDRKISRGAILKRK